ncbi:5-oxoprolinase subunit PxpB [Allopusillimonas soli]|uniref:5-oxoprolinase subunit PxpB n=1 Tax=Allopusillimonas soli TaxID=659016 RepID=A0A853FD74_9BURK|nr:5-oxoprolinase subunit PxpB [Allopusillimonas soli]NYT37592.1 5-oxoprolinase subunit PxpB [Allopusillimonas soli]TEA74444.1 5-oxoprolinase subunit PxpB [Allopusillimonas soli]
MPGLHTDAATWSIIPHGDRCILAVFGQGIDVAVGRRCAMAAQALRRAAIAGVTDVVPAFNCVAVHFEPRPPQTQLSSMASHIDGVLREAAAQDGEHGTSGENARAAGRLVEIPVCYGGEHGPDLEYVASHCGLDAETVIRLHSEPAAYVFMLGFAPGAPYIGVHDARLAIGRRETPRTRLPAGSVAIANRQTMIYPNASPGGWHIIGATPSILFDPGREPATLLAPGDNVRFVPISAAQYASMAAGKAHDKGPAPRESS